MKWVVRGLIGFVALIAIAVVVLLVLGGRDDAGKMRHSIEIAKPAEQVFPWITDPEKLKKWISWLVEIRMIQETPEKIGSKEVLVMNDPNNNQRVEMEAETVAWEENRRVGVKIRAEMGFEGTANYVLTPIGDSKTKLEYEGEFTYHHWLASLMEPLVTPQARSKLVGDMEKLKSLAEAN